jgi:hypothetical protein
VAFIYQWHGSSHMHLIRLALTDGEVYRSLMEKKEMLAARVRLAEAHIVALFKQGKAEGLFDSAFRPN